MKCLEKCGICGCTTSSNEEHLPLHTTDDRQRDEPDSNQSGGKTTKIFGYILLLSGVVLYGSSEALSQGLDKSVPHSELNGLRFFTQWILSALLVFGTGSREFHMEFNRWTVICAVSVTLYSYASYGATYYLPLGTLCGLFLSLQLIILMTASLIINRTISWDQCVAAVVCIAGIIMVVQPDFLFTRQNTSLFAINASTNSLCGVVENSRNISFNRTVNYNGAFNNTDGGYVSSYNIKNGLSEDIIGYILAFTNAFATAAVVLIFKYKLPSVDILLFNFWASLFGTIVSFIIMGISETPYFPNKTVCIVILIAHMIFAASNNFLYFRSYQIISPEVVALLQTIEIPFVFFLQYTFMFRLHPGRANTYEICGAVLVFAGNLLPPLHDFLMVCKPQRKPISM